MRPLALLASLIAQLRAIPKPIESAESWRRRCAEADPEAARMTPSASCDHCGQRTTLASLRQVQRAGGCRLWVCSRCDPAGTVDVEVVDLLRNLAATCADTGTAPPTELRPGLCWATTKG